MPTALVDVRFEVRVQLVTATLLVVYRQGFRSPRSSAGRLRKAREICSPREILSQQAICVLVAAALPRTAWIAEIDLYVGGDGEVLVVSHLLASIPGQGAAQLLGQFAHVFTERGYYGRRVLARDFEKHHKARMALDQRRDVGVVCFGEKVSFPVAWHGAIVGLGRPLADGSRIDDLSQSALGGAAFGLAHLPR